MSTWTLGFCPLLPDQLQNSMTTSFSAAICSQGQEGAHCKFTFECLDWYGGLENRLTRSETSNRESKALHMGIHLCFQKAAGREKPAEIYSPLFAVALVILVYLFPTVMHIICTLCGML